MKRAAFSLFLLACLAAALSGCARPRGVVVFSETYWREIIDRDPEFRSTLEREAARSRLALSFVDAPQGTNYFELLRKTVQDLPSELVITGPLLCLEVTRLAPLFPAKKFAVLDMPRIETPLPPNVVPVCARRAAAFYEAGKATGAALAGGRLSEVGQKVGVIVSGLTRSEKDALAEFERGFSVQSDADRIVVEELGTVSDRVKAARAVEDLLNRDVRLFFVKAYELNGACLERIVAAGAYFIIEDFATFGLSPEKLFISIDDDFSRPLSQLLGSGDFNFTVPPTLPARIRKGPVLEKVKEN